MKIKKFTCSTCGAPKVNTYKSPYIICDYCGNFTDIDYVMTLQAWKVDPERADKYQKLNVDMQPKLAEFISTKNKKEYFDLQINFWDTYYRLYPEYLPPSVHFDDKFYPQYLIICADSATQNAFDELYSAKANEQHQLRAAMQYYVDDEGLNKVTGDSFFKMMDGYIKYLREEFVYFYDNPDYEVMKKVLPYDTNLKMKLSMLVQIWVPYLSADDAKKFLQQTGFTADFIDTPKVEGHTDNCQFCKTEMFIPQNALKVHCEECHKTNIIKSKFNCMTCGDENEIPEYAVNTINCGSCGVENRLVTAMFG